MALTLLAANNAQTVLAAGINSSATTMTVNTGTGALFPTPSAGANYFKLTLIDAATGLLNEIVHVTARTGDTMTIVRAQEGTTARAWSANDIAANMMTAGSFSGLAQLDTAEFLNATTGRLLNVRTFTSSGTYTPTAGTKFVVVEVQGGGGGSGGVPATGSSSVAASGAGGAGAYAKAYITSGFSGVSVTVGAAGAAGTSGGGDGGTGGTSSFGSLVVCPGGNGGLSTGTVAVSFPTSRGGSSETAAPTGGNIISSKGKGGAGSTVVNGTVGNLGTGAASPFSAGGTGGDGENGSGAGGWINNVSQPARAGYAGGKGLVVVWEYA